MLSWDPYFLIQRLLFIFKQEFFLSTPTGLEKSLLVVIDQFSVLYAPANIYYRNL
jgi:hypothetical protein